MPIDVQAAQLDDLVVVGLPLLGADVQRLGIAPEHLMSVPRPAMFVAIGDRAGIAGGGDDVGLTLVLLGVEHLVGDAAPFEHGGEPFGGFDRGRTDQDRASRLGEISNLVDDRIELGLFGAKDEVAQVVADHVLVRRPPR